MDECGILTPPISLTAMNPERPSPEPDQVSAPFYAGLNRSELLLQRCRSCGTVQLGELYCNHCHDDALEWIAASGKGKVYSVAMVHMRYHDGFADDLPYNVVTVELDEGPRIYSNVIEVPHADVHIGMRVKAEFSQLSSGTRVPVFVPTAE